MSDLETKFGYIPNIPFTLEQHLVNCAELNTDARRLLESFHMIREKMIVNLRPVIVMFPHYSEHSHEHCEHIISAIEQLLGRSRIEKLSPSDTWLILFCAYMHDLGMIVQGKELQNDWVTDDFQAHIKECMKSNDNELKNAAVNVSSTEYINKHTSWPVQMHRDVILVASEFYRRKHSDRAIKLPQRAELKQMLNIVMSGDGKIPVRIQDTVGKICSAHGISFSEMLNLLKPTDSIFGYVFHPRFVATLLCIGDLCDLDNGRFNKMAIETFGGLTKTNLIHYYKHESITSFVIQKDSISLVFDLQSKNIKRELKNNDTSPVKNSTKDIQNFCDEVLLEAQNWISWLEDIIVNIKLYWNQLGISDIETMSPNLSYEILIDGKATITSKKNMRFSFSNEKAYALIEGYNLYNNKFVFIRELLQNSIDAIKIQFWNDIVSGRWNHFLVKLEEDGIIDYSKIQPFDFSSTSVFDYYKVNILVDHNETEQFATFVIEDNGTGISKEDVANKIVQTGTQKERNKTDFEMPDWLKPTAAFGIGLHSVFAVTDSLFAQTSTEMDQTVYNINMHSGMTDGYVFMSVAEQQNARFCNCKRGTRMELSLDVSNFESDNNEKIVEVEEPLYDRPESDFCRCMQESIKKMMPLALFQVTYKINDEDIYTCKKYQNDEEFGPLFMEKRKNLFLTLTYNNPNYDIAFSNRGRNLVIWDRNRLALVSYYLNGDYMINTSETCVRYKGFNVENLVLHAEAYGIYPHTVDYWGGDPKKVLNISRDGISEEMIEFHNKMLKEVRVYRSQVYWKLLKMLLSNNQINVWHKDILYFTSPWINELPDNFNGMQVLSDNLSSLENKYNYLAFTEKKLRIIILRYGFCAILKAKYYEIKEILEPLCKEKSKDLIQDIKCHIKVDAIYSLLNYINTSLSLYEIYSRDYCYLYDLYNQIIHNEFIHMFPDEDDSFYIPFNNSNTHTSGELYTANDLSFFMGNRRRFNTKNSKVLDLTPLDVYITISIPRIIYLAICSKIDISTSIHFITDELERMPGYLSGYGFIDANNVIDIMTSKSLSIYERKPLSFITRDLPFLSCLACKSIDVDAKGELIVYFSDKYEVREMINYKEKAFAKFLSIHRYSHFIPAPIGFEKIVIKGIDYRGVVHFSRYNYVSYLWDDFDNICKTYCDRIKKGERIENITDELMPNSRHDKKPITNLLRFIYHNRAFNGELLYEEAWKGIYETYREFMIMVLESVPQDTLNA